jgi:hypothetical protein
MRRPFTPVEQDGNAQFPCLSLSLFAHYSELNDVDQAFLCLAHVPRSGSARLEEPQERIQPTQRRNHAENETTPRLSRCEELDVPGNHPV